MKNALLVVSVLLVMGWVFLGQANPPDISKIPPMIMDMQLASPDDDPEPYVIQYIEGREKLKVQKVRVMGAPDTEDVFYVAYQTKDGQTCRNLWLVKISIGGDMASGAARNMSCDQARNAGVFKAGQKRAAIQYSPSYWPN